jgi:hypothetical protein
LFQEHCVSGPSFVSCIPLALIPSKALRIKSGLNLGSNRAAWPCADSLLLSLLQRRNPDWESYQWKIENKMIREDLLECLRERIKMLYLVLTNATINWEPVVCQAPSLLHFWTLFASLSQNGCGNDCLHSFFTRGCVLSLGLDSLSQGCAGILRLKGLHENQ